MMVERVSKLLATLTALTPVSPDDPIKKALSDEIESYNIPQELSTAQQCGP